jgi:hypothetical protein
MTQVPSVGRIVHVKIQGEAKPLIITAVNADKPQEIDGILFDASSPLGISRPLSGVQPGDGEGQWSWPPRV